MSYNKNTNKIYTGRGGAYTGLSAPGSGGGPGPGPGACVAIQGDNQYVPAQVDPPASWNTTSQYPMYGLYDYGAQAFIYLDSEFAGGPEYNIYKLSWYVEGWTTPYYPTENIFTAKIYMAHCQENEFPIGPEVDNSDLTLTDETLVFDGEINITANNTFKNLTLDTNFCYNTNNGNLLIRFENRSGDWQSGYGKVGWESSTNRAMRYWKDNSYPTLPGNRENRRIIVKLGY